VPAAPASAFPVRNTPRAVLPAVFRIGAALVLTAGLLLFIAAMRLSRHHDAPLLTLHALETVPPVSLPAPPPPPPETPPPPPARPELPLLELTLDPVAPPLEATLARDPELRLDLSDFAPRDSAPLADMLFASQDLDSQPRLLNQPHAPFPESQARQGVSEGRVVLEVLINAAGKVTVRRVLEASHPDFVEPARRFAVAAAFSPPQKDGRAVNALFRWPLILRP